MTSSQDHTQFFARIHIHGLTSVHGKKKPITLERYISFSPPVRSYSRKSLTTTDIDLSPRSLAPVFDLTTRVRFDSLKTKTQNAESSPGNSLGHGRSGLVFPLELLSIFPSSDPRAADLMVQLPPLCIKVAMPGYARFLAREAWFYEYLDANGLTGVVSPRCYGVFHAALGTSRSNMNLEVDISNYDYYSAAKQPIYEPFALYTAPMWEEYYDTATNTLSLAKYFLDDRKGSYRSSPWRLFRQSPKSTTLTILVMDLLGEPMTLKDFEEDWDGDIQSMYDDLAPLFIIHNDNRFPNLLRVPHHAQRQCKTHMCSHKWNFIDWESASLQCDNSTTRCIQRNQCISLMEYSLLLGGSRRRLRN